MTLDCGANVAWLGRWRRLKADYGVFAGDHRGGHSHCHDSAHVAKTGTGLTLFKHALKDYRLKPVDSFATESPVRLKPPEAFAADSRLKARWAP